MKGPFDAWSKGHWLAAATLWLLAQVSLGQGVDVRNLNFNYYQPYYHFAFADKSGFDFGATYNSRAHAFRGITGNGWCTDPETMLEWIAEGNLRLILCGAGPQFTFLHAGYSPAEISRTVDAIVAAVRANKKVDEASISKFRADLASDEDLRTKFAKSYHLIGAPVAGARWCARETDRNNKDQEICVVFDGTVYALGERFVFDRNGRLVTERLSKSIAVDYHWKGNRLQSASVSGGSPQYTMHYDERGALSEVDFEGNGKVQAKVAFRIVDGHRERESTTPAPAKGTWDTAYTFDSEGRVTGISAGSGSGARVWKLSYGAIDEVNDMTRDDGCVEVYRHSDVLRGKVPYSVTVDEECPPTSSYARSFWQGGQLSSCDAGSDLSLRGGAATESNRRLLMLIARNVAEAGDPFDANRGSEAKVATTYGFDMNGRLTSVQGLSVWYPVQSIRYQGSSEVMAGFRTSTLDVDVYPHRDDVQTITDRSTGTSYTYLRSEYISDTESRTMVEVGKPSSKETIDLERPENADTRSRFNGLNEAATGVLGEITYLREHMFDATGRSCR